MAHGLVSTFIPDIEQRVHGPSFLAMPPGVDLLQEPEHAASEIRPLRISQLFFPVSDVDQHLDYRHPHLEVTL